MELKKYKLADIGKVITGKTPSTSVAENYACGTIPFYTPEDVAKGLGMMGRNNRFITQTGFEEIASNTITGESVLVGCIGSDMGNVAYSNITCATNQQINSITQFINGVEPLYVYYLLSTMKPYFQKIAGSTTTPILPKSVFEEIEIHLPDIKIQKDVVSILYALDRKIELNKQINDNLEAMAKQLYDYWFVQFDFPNEEGKPYKSSGGAMVWNEKLKREIPQGWDFCFLENLLTIRNGRDHKHLADGIYPVYGSGGEMRKVSEYLYNGESVLMPRKGSLNNIMYVNEAFWTVDTMFYSEMKLSNCAKYIYYTIKDIDFTRWDSGTGVPSMTSSTLYSIKLVKPQNETLKKFDEMISPLFEQMKQISEQNVVLTKLRDELLPLLMNGQASVNYHLSDD
mgnify:CR=1 FL=1